MADKMQGNSTTDYLMEDTVKATGMEGEQPEDGAQGAPSGKAEPRGGCAMLLECTASWRGEPSSNLEIQDCILLRFV